MSATKRSSRRDVLKTIGGVLGGVSLLGHSTAQGQALGSLPNGYSFYRIISSNQGGTFSGTPNVLGDITGAVMMSTPPSKSGIGYVYVHGTRTDLPNRPAGVFEVAINFSQTPPVVQRVSLIAGEGRSFQADGKLLVAGHVGTGASNALGQYVTTIEPIERGDDIDPANAPGVFVFQPHGNGSGVWSRVIGFGDEVPDGSGLYGGDFGDVAIDDDQNLLLAAATTHSPDDTISGFGGSQALIATSLMAKSSGRVLLQTGDMLPFGAGVVESIGLVDLAPRNAFAAQVTARPVGPSAARSGTALLVGNTQGIGPQSLVAVSPELMPLGLASQRSITSGETYFGPRVDALQDVAFVTHDGTFESSIGSNALETLGYYSHGTARKLQSNQLTASDSEVLSFGAPCIGSTGFVYGTEMLGSGSSRLFVSNGTTTNILLRSGEDRVPGRNPDGNLILTEILLGQHSNQVDKFGNIVFTAEFKRNPDPRFDQTESNFLTALVIGIPK